MRIGRRFELVLLSPLGVLLAGMILLPVAILFGYSFFAFLLLRPSGGPTLANYLNVLGDPLYRTLTINTLAIALPTTLLSVSGGFAIAYFVVFGTGRGRRALLVLVVTALLASYLVRIYAWRTLLGENGIVNGALLAMGLIGQPLEFLVFSRLGAVVAEVNLFLPFAALTFYASLAGIPPEFREASRDLGAGRLQTLLRVTMPLSGRAILATTAFVFFLACGDYITPVLVGGVDSVTLGTVIATDMGQAGQYGAGAALSFLVLAGFVLLYAGLRATMTHTRLLPASA
jgi:ABC-type spermidine/putrescine transport system permease subunit I